MFVDRGSMLLLPVLLALFASAWTPTGARVIQKRAAFYIANDTMCIVDGDVFYNGDPVPTDDECERCTCRPPGFSCVLRDCDTKPGCKAVRRAGECCPEYVCGCVHNNRVYEDGEVIRDLQNACYTCRCHGSSISCTFAECLFRGDCPPEYVQGECCPRYDHCPPLRTTSTTAPSTVFTTESSTHLHIIQQEEQFFNLTTQHLEKFTDEDTTVRVEDVRHSSTSSFTTVAYDTSTLPTVIVKFILTDGPISSIADFDITTLSSVLPLQTATYTESTRYALPDEADGGLSTTQESFSFADHTTSPSSLDVVTDSSTIDRYASSSAIEDISSESSTIDYSAPSTSQPEVSTESSVNFDVSTSLPTKDLSESTTAHYEATSSSSGSNVSSESAFIAFDTSSSSTTSDSVESTATYYETSFSSSLSASSDSSFNDSDAYSSSTTSDTSEGTATHETTSSGVSSEEISIDYDASTFTAASASSEDTVVDYKDPSSTTVDYSSESSSTNYDAHPSTSVVVSSEDTVLDNKASSADISDVSTDSSSIDYDASTPTTSSEDTTVDNEEFSVASEASTESSSIYYVTSTPSADPSFSEGTTIYYEVPSTTSSSSSESTTVAYETFSFSTTTLAPSESFSTDENSSSYSPPDVSSESSAINYDSNSSFTSDASPEDTAVDNEASSTFTSKISSEKHEFVSTTTVKPIDKISGFETHTDLQTEESLDVRGVSADKYTPSVTESFLNYTSTEVDVSTEYPSSSSTHSTILISEDNEIKVIQESEVTSTFSSDDEFQPSTVEENIKWSNNEYNLTDDLTDSQLNEISSVSDVDESSFSTIVPHKEEINITETNSSSTTRTNPDINTSTQHVPDVSSTITVTESYSSVETFYSQDALSTMKPTEFSEIDSTTQESIKASSTDDEIINAESDQASKIAILPDSITTAANASEEQSANYTAELLESSGYTGDQSSFGIDKEIFTTEQPSEILDVKSITELPEISETSIYDELQTTDQSLYSTSEDKITGEHYTSTESSDKTTESPSPITTVESNAVSESGIVSHVSFQTNALTTEEYPEKDNIGESTATKTIENFDSKTTENIHTYSTELSSTEIVNEFSSISEITENSSSKSANELPATVSAADFSLEHDDSLFSSEAVEFNDRNETTTRYPEVASTEVAQSIDVTQIPNKNDVDELILSNNESEVEKLLNISSYFEENSSIQPEETNDSLDVKTSSFTEQSISENIITEKQLEDGTTHFNEINSIDGTEEKVSNESIVKPLEGDDVNLIQSTTTEFYPETTTTDVSEFTSTFKPTTEYDFNKTALSSENEGKNPLNESFITPFENIVASDLEEVLNKHLNLSRNPFAPHTNLPNNLEENNANGTPDFENNADYITVSTTEHFDDGKHYTTEGQIEDIKDSETSQSKLGTAVNEDLNEKTEIALVTLHPLKTDLSGLLSVNNKQSQTTEMQSTTEGINGNNSEQATKPFYGNQTEYESIETSTSDLDKTESHVFHSNLEEVSNNAFVDSFPPENLNKNTTSEELVNGNTENIYFDTHDFSFPLITSGIPGEGLFTKYAQFHDHKFIESTSLTNNFATDFTESEEGKQNVEETDENEKELIGTNQSTDFPYDVADAEVITISDALNNTSTLDENSSVTLSENNEVIPNKTNVEYNDLDTEISSITENDASANLPHETTLLNNEQDINDSNLSQINGTAINQILASLTPDNSSFVSEEHATHQEFDDYSALDAEEDITNDTLVSQQVNSGSEKTVVSVANNATSEEDIKSSDSPAENRPLDDAEEFTKIGNSSLDSELLSSEDTASSSESIEKVVTKEEIFSSPNIYHAEDYSFNTDVHATKTTENTSLESEFTENSLITYSSPKENNVEVELHTQVSDIIASSTYTTNSQNSEETQTSTTTIEDNFSTSFPQTYESTQFSISPSQPTEDAILNIFPESVKIHSDLFQNPTIPGSDNGADGSLDENTKLPSNLEKDYFSKATTTIQEEKVTEVNQAPKLATEESLPQTETISLDSDEVTDSGKTTISEIKPQSTTVNSDSVTDNNSNSELLIYNNHRGKEPELVSVQSSETTNTNHINILFGQTTVNFSTSEKTEPDSVTPVSESQSQTEKNEPAETYFTIDENNYGIALHEIGDPQNIKPGTVDSTSAVKTTDENTETNSPDLHENKYDHEETTNDLNSKSQAGEKSTTISYEKTESSAIVEVGSYTTPSQENFSVIGYLGDLLSGINVYSSPDTTDITQTESINSSQEYPNDNRENTENPPVDPINAIESKPEQSIYAHLSSSAGTITENIVTEIMNAEKSEVASITENELQTVPNSDTQSTQEVFRDEIQESSYTTQKGLEATEDPIPKSYISSLSVSIEKNDNLQVSSNPHTSSDDSHKNDEWEGEFSSDSVDSAKPNSVSDHPNKPTKSYETTNFISTTSELPNSSEKGPDKGGKPIIPSITPLKHESEEEETPDNAHVEDLTENSKLSNDINYATTLASYVFYRGKDNETIINKSEKVVSTKPNQNNNDEIIFDNTEVKSTDVIPIEPHESVTSVQDVNKSHQAVYYSNDGSFSSTDDYKSTASEDSSLNSELPENFVRNITTAGIVNNTLKMQSFQPYSLFDVISNVFKAPGYDAEVHSTFLKEQVDISKKENPVGVVKRDTKQREERQISEIYEAAISETKNLEPEPRRLQAKKFVSSEGFAFSNSNPQQQQPAFASVTSSFIIVDRVDDSSRSRRKIPIRNPGGEVQEIEVPASFTFPPSFRFPSRSATKNEKESQK